MLRSEDVDRLTKAEIKERLKDLEGKNTSSKKTKKMKTSKKALLAAFTIAIMLILFSMLMIYLEKDTSTLEILATAGVGCLPIMYGIYSHNSTKINLKHMEECYDPNYDDNQGLY